MSQTFCLTFKDKQKIYWTRPIPLLKGPEGLCPENEIIGLSIVHFQCFFYPGIFL